MQAHIASSHREWGGKFDFEKYQIHQPQEYMINWKMYTNKDAILLAHMLKKLISFQLKNIKV